MNVVFLLAAQLRAASPPLHGESQIDTPNIDRLAAGGVVFENALSTCPVCSPCRSMLVTGRQRSLRPDVLQKLLARLQ